MAPFSDKDFPEQSCLAEVLGPVAGISLVYNREDSLQPVKPDGCYEVLNSARSLSSAGEINCVKTTNAHAWFFFRIFQFFFLKTRTFFLIF